MPKNRTHKRNAHLEGLNKRLKSENNKLKNEINHLVNILQEKYPRILEESLEPKICSFCGKGSLEIIDIVGRQFETCDTCDYRKKIN